MSKPIEQMTPNEIIQAVRARDKRWLKTLVRNGVVVKKIWTQAEVAEMLDVDISTISRWINNDK